MAIQFYLTDAGRAAALDADNLGITLSLAQIAVGSAKYNAEASASSKTTLTTELARYPLNGGSVEPISKTLRFIANIESTITANIFEIGIFTENNTLFAIAATTENIPLLQLSDGIISLVTFGFKIADIDISNLVISIDPDTPISVELMNQHLAHLDPHPQYVKKLDNDGNLGNKADKTTTITAGDGLTGGGDLSANRTFTLGTPSKITDGTTNQVTSESHTHEIDKASTTIAGIVQLNDSLTSTSITTALTARAGKDLQDQINNIDISGGSVTSAQRLTTARTIAMTGDANWSVSFDGSANVSSTITIADDAIGTTKIADAAVTNSKINSVDASKITTGTMDNARLDNASTSQKGIVQLNNTLTSTATDQALTAAQGKVLNDKINNIEFPEGAGPASTTQAGIVQLDNTSFIDLQTSANETKAVTPKQLGAAINKMPYKVFFGTNADGGDSNNTNTHVRLLDISGLLLGGMGQIKGTGNITVSAKSNESTDPDKGSLTIHGEVIDNLTSDSSLIPLSANQGMVLKNMIEAIDVPEGVDISGKYDKTGGVINGDVDVQGHVKSRDGFTIANEFSIVNEPVTQSTAYSTNLNWHHFNKPIKAEGQVVSADSFYAYRQESVSVNGDTEDILTHIKIYPEAYVTGDITHSDQTANQQIKFETNAGRYNFDRQILVTDLFCSGNLSAVDGWLNKLNLGNYSRYTNGYTSLPNGMIMQWGYDDLSYNPGEGNSVISFPIAFPNACLTVTATRKTISGSGDNSDGGLCIHDFNTSTVSIHYNTFYGSADNSLRGCHWIAIGY